MTELKKYAEISDFWINYKDALRNYILKIVRDEDTANEISHEVLMKVYSSCCSGRTIRNIRSWLFQIAYNSCMDYFKKSGKTVELTRDLVEEEDHRPYEGAGEFVLPLLKLLPEKYSRPVEMADLKGLKQQEVAEKLGLSLTATKTRIQRGRKLLREQITECVQVEVDSNGKLMAFNVKGTCEALQSFCGNTKDSCS